MLVKFVNLCPHDINIVRADESILTLPKSGTIARVAETRAIVASVEGVELFTVGFGNVVDLPPPVGGTVFVVSALVRAACPDRPDLASPGALVRGPDGQPIGCRGLTVNS